MSDETTPQSPPASPPAPAPAKEKAASDEKRYAAYDVTYLKFVGDVCKTKADATKQAKDRKVKRYEIREV